MSKPWFDSETGLVRFDAYVAEMPSFKAAMEDAVITEGEVAAQARKVASLFKQLEGLLSPEAQAVATDALCELAVLNVLHARHLETQR
jgi:hypothetical protein